jgi:hypothetical protein
MKNAALILLALTSLSFSAQAITCKYISTSGTNVDGRINQSMNYTSDYYLNVTKSSGGYDLKNGDVKVLGQGLENVSSDSNYVILNQKFGSRFDLIGYYGTIKFQLNLATGDAVLTTHSIPHFISDINAPQPENTEIDVLKCK